MRQLLTTILAVFILAGTSLAQDVLPFPVTLSDQSAVITDQSTIYSVIEKPVASNAVMAVKDVEGQIIVNIFPTDEKGEAKTGVQPAVLLFDAGASKSISDNMQGTQIAPGYYLANVVGGGKTSRVFFQVK